MRYITHNWRLKLLSLFLACTTWVAVAYASNPPSSTTRSINVETGPPPAGLVPLTAPPSVNVTVYGLQHSVASFDTKNLRASVDITGAHKGHNLAHVRVDNTDSHVLVRNVQPSTVDVVLDRVISATRKVDVRFTGSPSSCCVAKTAAVTPDMVTLTGPESLVTRAVAIVNVDVTDRAADTQATLPVKIEVPGQKEPQVTSNPRQVSVTVPIERIQSQAKVPVLCCDWTGLSSGYRVVRYDISPISLVIEGNQDVLSKVTTLESEPLDLSGVTTDVIRTLVIRVPAGVTVLTKGPFTAHLFIQPQPGVTPGQSPSP
jgi:YbbR domain-containing protein